MTTPQWLGRSYTETSSMYSETPMSESETPILERDSLQMAQDQPDPAVEAVLRPRTLSALMILLSCLLYVAVTPDIDSTETNVKLGITAAVACFVFIGMLQFRDGPFVRPHVVFWRAVLSLSVLYQMALVFFLFLNKHQARQMLKFVYPELGVALPDRSYAEGCDLTLDNFKNQIDIFVLAHILGWYAKALILRDYWFCWILSIMFEVMEYSLQHQLANFAECWWDHWILDVLICNWAGIYLGMKTCQYFEVKHYSWAGHFRHIKGIKGKAKRAVQQFTPHDWTRFEWKTTNSFKRWIAVLALLVVFLQCEINCFYLKYLVWVPPEHPLLTYRLILMFFFALPATREAYQYLVDRNTKRFGPHAWTMLANIFTETLICIKYGRGEFPEPAPLPVVLFWSFFTTGLVSYTVWRFWWLPKARKNKATTEQRKSQ
ncbi:hypothetical protein INT43_005861 [Umbelopsis isabellina]|uniref:Phosphatidylserine synthase 2 n=1 Tax=Mortierella isabellina TaxID=91625 RepID=A0A8H7PJR8_MORIS|nr:hypothetical protein INT43_005861 [Umbelopsis isabellina]